MRIKILFLLGILLNFGFFLIRFFVEKPLGWSTIYGVIDIDLFRDFELYSVNIIHNYPIFLYFIHVLDFLLIPNEFSCGLIIFSCNMLIGVILYKIKLSTNIVFIYYFNPITIFYFSMMLLNSCVFTLFLLIAYYYLIREKYGVSLVFWLIAMLMKQYAIMFSLIWFYEKFKNFKYRNLIVLSIPIGFLLLFTVNINIFFLNSLKMRITNRTLDYGVELFPQSVFSAILSYLLLTIFTYLTIKQKDYSILKKLIILLLLFDLFSQFGICKYYIYASLLFTLLELEIEEKQSIWLFFVLFFIPRLLLMPFIALVIVYILKKKTSINYMQFIYSRIDSI